VALAVLVLAAAAYFFLRPDPAQEPVPAATPVTTAPTDSLATDTTAARATPPPADDSAGTAPASAATGSARVDLLHLSDQLTQLADRSDLRDDAGIREQRDNFTSATARLADDDPQASLRPGLVAAANLLLPCSRKPTPTSKPKPTRSPYKPASFQAAIPRLPSRPRIRSIYTKCLPCSTR